MSERTEAFVWAAVVFVGLILLFCFLFAPAIRSDLNQREYEIRMADDATRYATRKKVEDACRSMISSYESDRLTYETYKGSGSDEKSTWAEQAKIRANRTAVQYNEYVLKNKYVWNGNVPEDIKNKLPYLE